LDKTLVLFDFDGTITTHDTMFELVKFYHGKNKFYQGMLVLLPRLLLFKAGLVQNQAMKEAFMTYFWRGTDNAEFERACKSFFENKLTLLLRSKAMEQLKEYVNKGYDVAVVSASAEDWVKPFCDAHSIKCLSSVLEREANKITGKIKGINCNGEEKVVRIKDAFDIKQYKHILAYGDSSGDKPMLQLATQAYFKPFR